MKNLLNFAVTIMTIMILFCHCKDYKKNRFTEHIIVIGIDGLSPDGIRNSVTPNIDKLIANGAFTMYARSVLPTSSSSNWSAMIMGAGPEQTGITSNDWMPDDYILPAVTKDKYGYFPTIFSTIKQQKPELVVGAIYHWDGFGRLFPKGVADLDTTLENEVLTTAEVKKFIEEKKPNFLFIQYDNVDGAGHEFGHGSKDYYREIEHTDSLIGEVLNSIKNAGMLEKTTIILCSDHGGKGYGHGGESMAEITIPFIMCGKAIKKNYKIQCPVYQYDNAATVAFLLGIEQPKSWIGRPVKSAIQNISNDIDSMFLNPLPSPLFVNHTSLQGYPGGLFINQKPLVKLKAGENTDIYYTLDGSNPTVSSKKFNEAFFLDSSAIVKAIAVLGAGNEKSEVVTAYFRVIDNMPFQGVQYNYYENTGKDWSFLPDFSKLSPKSSGEVNEFSLMGITNPKTSQFAILLKGFLKIDKSGIYKFYLQSDDGAVLYIDDREIMNNDGSHGIKEKTGEIELAKGMCKIELRYFNGTGGGWLDLLYSSKDIPKQIVPASALFKKKQI